MPEALETKEDMPPTRIGLLQERQERLIRMMSDQEDAMTPNQEIIVTRVFPGPRP
jgi:hypothetical protein